MGFMTIFFHQLGVHMFGTFSEIASCKIQESPSIILHVKMEEIRLTTCKVGPLPVITGFITPITRVIRTVCHL